MIRGGFMNEDRKDIEFNSVFDLYTRVKPALKSKLKELKREKFDYIKEEDIWNYLVKKIWIDAHGLVLCDVVNDILNAENKKIDAFVKEEHQKRQEELLVEELDLL